jgi:HAD superfamily hydrolase (TIGR01549 family)
MSFEAVLFDAGNTLVHAHPGRLTEIFRSEGSDADEDSVAEAELQARRVLHDAIKQGHAGTEPEVWHEYFVALFRRGGVPADRMEAVGRKVRDVHAVDHLWSGVAQGTEEALSSLLSAGLRLGVISNADGRMEALLERCGLGRYFEFVVDSQVVGVEKPDPAIFREGCRRLGLPPASCLYVGDLYPVDYVGATGAGLSAVLLDPLGLCDHQVPTVASLSELPAYVASAATSPTGP